MCAKVLDSRYFGVSQTRTRVFFVGVRSDVTSKVGLTFMNIGSVFPENNDYVVPLEDALIGLQ